MSLKNKCETAVLALLKTAPELRDCHPKASITSEQGGDFPCLWVRAQRPAKIAPNCEIYKVPVQIGLETQFDDPRNDSLFTLIETLTGEHLMIQPVNESGSGIHAFDNNGEADAEIIGPNFRTQTISLTLVCCETQ